VFNHIKRVYGTEGKFRCTYIRKVIYCFSHFTRVLNLKRVFSLDNFKPKCQTTEEVTSDIQITAQ
jgi:hypothetical protein